MRHRPDSGRPPPPAPRGSGRRMALESRARPGPALRADGRGDPGPRRASTTANRRPGPSTGAAPRRLPSPRRSGDRTWRPRRPRSSRASSRRRVRRRARPRCGRAHPGSGAGIRSAGRAGGDRHRAAHGSPRLPAHRARGPSAPSAPCARRCPRRQSESRAVAEGTQACAPYAANVGPGPIGRLSRRGPCPRSGRRRARTRWRPSSCRPRLSPSTPRSGRRGR